jgi:uncharacterized OB-fold protein
MERGARLTRIEYGTGGAEDLMWLKTRCPRCGHIAHTPGSKAWCDSLSQEEVDKVELLRAVHTATDLGGTVQ